MSQPSPFADKLKIPFMRSAMRLFARFIWRKQQPQVAIHDALVPSPDCEIPVRVYSPPGEGPFPVVVYFHGGGFVVGDIETHHALCFELSERAQSVVVSVDYRLAPEHPFPAAVEDCLAATHWALAQAAELKADPQKLVVAGDSAGGNLAAVVAIQFREKQVQAIRGQVLLYPVTDHYDPATPSYLENAKGQGLTRGLMIWFWDTYLRNSPLLKEGETRHPLATPLHESELKGLPPALVITAEKDPLRDEGLAYADALAEQGVAVQSTTYQGAQHGFIGAVGPNDDHYRGLDEISAWLQQLWSAGS